MREYYHVLCKIFIILGRWCFHDDSRSGFQALKVRDFSGRDFDNVIFFVFDPVYKEFTAYDRRKFRGDFMKMRRFMGSFFIMLYRDFHVFIPYEIRFKISYEPPFCEAI